MILGLVVLYILKMENAPIWCFVLVWIHIVFRALNILLPIARRNRYERQRHEDSE
jgi:hypothetical protein